MFVKPFRQPHSCNKIYGQTCFWGWTPKINFDIFSEFYTCLTVILLRFVNSILLVAVLLFKQDRRTQSKCTFMNTSEIEAISCSSIRLTFCDSWIVLRLARPRAENSSSNQGLKTRPQTMTWGSRSNQEWLYPWNCIYYLSKSANTRACNTLTYMVTCIRSFHINLLTLDP